jgi:glyceraldehyde 3-phosphate dehydrogenase
MGIFSKNNRHYTKVKFGEIMANIAINGFGRIGRSVLRIIIETNSDINVSAINDLGNYENLAYLLKHDSVMGVLDANVSVEDDVLIVDDRKIKLTSIKDPSQLPWNELKIDVVIESTGIFRDNASLQKHIDAGAKKVLLTVPPKDDIDATIVLGVNNEDLKPEHKVVSNASCTTNCLAPIAKVLDDNFGIKSGLMTTVHAYTNDQALAEGTHSDFRRGRSATQNIIPTSTGAAKAVGMVLPKLNGKLDGMAMRVPVPDGSVVDLVVELEKNVTLEELNSAIKDAANTTLKGILEYSEVPLVSTDILQNPHSSIYDSTSTQILDNNHVKVVCWYDNEWGYSNRVVDLIKELA